LSAVPATAPGSSSYEARLARRVLLGDASASPAAMELLDRCQPQTIDAAVALLAEQGNVSVDAFDCLADAWTTYRHLIDLSWD
jgi:NADPH-dependent ferric siderophore reductase